MRLLAGWKSDQELKRLNWLARGAVVVESDIFWKFREAILVQTEPGWEPRFARNCYLINDPLPVFMHKQEVAGGN